MSIIVPFLGIISMENNLPTSSTRRSWKSLCNYLCLRESEFVEYWVKELIELLRLTTQNCSLLINKTFVHEIHSNLHHSGTCTLTITCLKEPELTLLNCELHILHIVIVVLKSILNLIELLIDFRHSLLHRRILCNTLSLRYSSTLSPTLRANFCNLLWCADTSHNVLALCVDEILTIEEILTISCITREANTSSRCIAHVTEYHSHY